MQTNMMRMKWLAISMLLFPIAVTFGCGSSGPATSVVTGSVTMDGVPVESGHVVFRSKNGIDISAAGPVENGTYTLETVPGEKTVVITAMRDVPGKFDESNPGEKVQLTEQYIPKKYNDDSELSVVIGSDEETHDFTLSSS